MQKEHFLASMRLRINPAIEAIKLLGLEPKLFVLRSEHPEDLELLEKSKPVISIIGKLSHPDEDFYQRIRMANLAGISILKNANVPIILDYSDNHAEGSESRNNFWKLLLKESNKIIVPTTAMKEQLRPKLQQKAIIIQDPLEGPSDNVLKKDFKNLSNSSKGLNLLWFGHHSNLVYLPPWLELLRNYEWPININIRILTRFPALKTLNEWLKEQPEAKSSWKHIFINYQKQSDVFTVLKKSHIVLVPSTSDPSDLRKRAASHNRVSESLNAGRLVLAQSIPAYKELLPKQMLVNDNKFLVQKLNGLISNWKEGVQWVESKQPIIKKTFSKEQIIEKWVTELKLVLIKKANN